MVVAWSPYECMSSRTHFSALYYTFNLPRPIAVILFPDPLCEALSFHYEPENRIYVVSIPFEQAKINLDGLITPKVCTASSYLNDTIGSLNSVNHK